MRQLEYQLQKAVVEWIGYSYPNLLYCASAGGMRTNIVTAKKMKATGYKKGLPDLFIYQPNKKFYGLAIEIKVKGNYPTRSQKEWITRLNKAGYYAQVCKGFEQTSELINKYVNNDL